MPQSLLEMAKDLVMAQIQVRPLCPDDMRHALHHTYSSLAALHAQENTDSRGAMLSVDQTPATPPVQVDWRKSITKHSVMCLECGARFKQLSGRHFRQHTLDAQSYRAKYGIPRTQPLAAKATTTLRKQIVQQNRPWEKAPAYQKAHPAQAQTTPPSRRRGKSRTARVVA